MSTTTGANTRIDMTALRPGAMIEIAEGSEHWLHVHYVHRLPVEHRVLVDGTLYVQSVRGRDFTVEFLDTETPRLSPTPVCSSWWRQLRDRWRR